MLTLKEKRLALGVSRTKLSELSGIPLRTLEDMESNGNPKIETAAKAAAALGLTLNDIWQD